MSSLKPIYSQNSMSNSTAPATMARRSNRDTKVTSSQVVSILDDKEVDKHVKLEIVINHIFGLMKNNSLEEAKSLLYQLVLEFRGDKECFLPWVRFLDIAHVHKTNKSRDKEEEEDFQGEIEKILKGSCLGGQHSKNKKIDWRIARKMMSLHGDFSFSYSLKQIDEVKHILSSLKCEIHIALEYLLWQKESVPVDLAKKNLNSLLQLYDRSNRNTDLLLEAVLSGRFDKTKFDITNSIILGEDGGLYLLLNRLSPQQQEALISQQIVTRDYLKDKVKAKDQVKGDKVVLGTGGFGTVRVGMSLFRSRSRPAEIVCIKKTQNFTKLGLKPTTLEQITMSTLGDYFTNDRAEAIYSPCTFDMSLVTAPEVIKHDKKDHRKGYLMMEMLPQNTAAKIFSQEQYQKWEYQKPYLIDVLKKTLQLLDSNIAMTDLKPANTLYNIDTRKATIIGLDGTIKVANREELEQFDQTKHSFFPYTPGFISPELFRNKGVVDMYMSLAYTCGKVIEEVTKKTDYKKETISGLIGKLTSDPEIRLSIHEAIQELDKMGDNLDTKSIIFSHYISKVKERLGNKKSAISINEDIEKTRELFIPLNATAYDPSKYDEQETEDLSKKIQEFLDPKNTNQQVMAIFGVAGSGKSILLQLKFIEAVYNWKPDKPLPIYINLANGIELNQIVKTLNTELGTHLTMDLLDGQHLYIDSFDEGLGIETKRETLIKEYLEKLGSPKIIVTCRTDYLQEGWQKWFSPEFKEFELCYVAPINYNGHQDMTDMVKKYVNYSKKHTSMKKTTAEYLERFKDLQLTQLIDTGFMFYLVMEVLFTLYNRKDRRINKLDIYARYIYFYQDNQMAKLKNQEQKEKIVEMISFYNNEKLNLTSFVTELGKYLASQMHLRGVARLDHSNKLFTALGFDSSVLLKHQSIIHILQLLPLKIITTHSGKKIISNQEVKIDFMHETIKNYYLVEAIKSEIEIKGKSQILATKSIADDFELVRLIACALQDDTKLRNTFLNAIDDTKTDKSNSSIIYGSNCMTLLVAAKHSFSGCDLTNISVKHANLVNGVFHNANLSYADLSGADMNNVNLMEASLDGAIMKGVKFLDSLSATLEGHTKDVSNVSFSPDGKFLVSGSEDKTIKIWNPTTGECLQTLNGHVGVISSISFSSDGKFLASGSEDKTIKIWNPTTGECLQTLNGHAGVISSVSFSSDGKLLASSSRDGTIKIWNTTTFECLQILNGHTDVVRDVSFSPDGNFLASGSDDATVKIWNPKTGECLHSLNEHANYVISVSFSPDGKFLASSSKYQTIRIWNPKTGECIQTLPGNSHENSHWVMSMSFSPDSKFLVSGAGKTLKIWNPITGKCLKTLNGHYANISSVSFSPHGEFLASGFNGQTIKIWKPTIKECLQTLSRHAHEISSVSFSPNGKFLASGSSDKTIKIWNPTTGECFQTLNGHTHSIESVSFSPDGKFLASCSDRTIKIWNLTTGECLQTLNGHTGDVWSVSFSPDGKLVASGSGDETIKIWNPTTGECLHTLNGHTHHVNSVSFSPDGRFLASGSLDYTIKIWNPETGGYLENLDRLSPYCVSFSSVSFSPDGNSLVSGSNDFIIRIWNPKTGECLRSLDMHSDYVKSVSFSPDGRFIASCSDKTIKIWNPTTLECLQTITGHTAVISNVSFSSNGKFLASGSKDQTIKVFEIHRDRWLLKNNITASVLPLRADLANLNNTIISHNNRLLLYQNGANETDENFVSDNDSNIDQIEPSLDNASESIRTADQLSHTFFPEKLASFPNDLDDSRLLKNQRRKNWWTLLVICIPLWILSKSKEEFS